MPFTPSHIAAVIPLISKARIRRYLDPWTLALGAMAPDVPLFVPGVSFYSVLHSPTGVLLCSIPVTLTIFAVFQWLLRDPLTALLSPAAAGKVAALPRPTWRRSPALAAGAMTGYATHVLWDSFTHAWHRLYWNWAWLDATVHGSITVYRVLQYTSSALGLGLVVWWILRSLSRQEARPVPARLVLPAPVRHTVLAVTITGTCLAGLLWPTVVDPPRSPGWSGIAVKSGTGIIAGCCLIIIGYAVLWHATKPLRRPGEATADELRAPGEAN